MDSQGATDSHSEVIDLDTMELCLGGDYNLNSVQENGCNLIAGSWETSLGYTEASDYSVYRCEGTAGNCSVAGDFSFENVDKDCAGDECVFEDSSVDENTSYYYFISTSGEDNNSTLSPECDGASGICPLGDKTPICPIESTSMSINRTCGSLTVSWPDSSAEGIYRVHKCINSASDKCLNAAYFENHDSIISSDYSCSGGECSLTDNEIIPVNIVNPDSSNYYCYKISAQNEEDEWSDLPDTPICEYSFCYRAPDWQER